VTPLLVDTPAVAFCSIDSPDQVGGHRDVFQTLQDLDRRPITFTGDGRTVIAASATLRIPVSGTIAVAASWNSVLRAVTYLPASGNARARERWDAFVMSRRCLIVDDNSVYLSEARALLQRQGMNIVGVASNSGDALAIAASDRLDVALVDVDLGAESGLDVAHALAMSNEPVPVILISAYAEKDLRELLEDSPAVGFLAKSVVSRAAIDNLLGEGDENRGT
jgi:CheY-like chemotaxis protein